MGDSPGKRLRVKMGRLKQAAEAGQIIVLFIGDCFDLSVNTPEAVQVLTPERAF